MRFFRRVGREVIVLALAGGAKEAGALERALRRHLARCLDRPSSMVMILCSMAMLFATTWAALVGLS